MKNSVDSPYYRAVMVNIYFRYRFLLRLSTGVALLLVFGVPNVSFAQQVSVPATFHRQEHSLSCEVATLKMALGVHGINVPESELISKLPFDTTPKGAGVWGDPNIGFVGKINGRMLIDGYGVYWDPIAALGNEYATASVMRHGSAPELARAITDGNPVIVWGYYGGRSVYNWKTLVGKVIHAVGGEHVRLVYGFDGPVDAPTRFYLLDPITGYMTWSPEQLMHNWSSLHHMGVVVSKNPRFVRVPGESAVWEIDSTKNTRRFITTWSVFTARGGSPSKIDDINKAALLQYTLGAPIL